MNNKVKVLVTRPGAQSPRFVELLTEAGFTSICLPTIEINLTTTDLSSALQSDLIIFTSVNSVIGAHRSLALPWQTQAKIAAIGQTTASAIQALQTQVDLMPEGSANSEALLAVIGDEFKNIAIIRGDSGREMLHDTLTSQGADVQYHSVYERSVPQYAEAYLHNLFADSLPDIISVTSDLGLTNLLQIIPPQLKPEFLKQPLVVNSQRCANNAKQAGFSADIQVAIPPGDSGQLDAISHIAHDLLTQR